MAYLVNVSATSAVYWPFKSIKRIKIIISYDLIEYSKFVGTELTKLCAILRNCSLAQLRITAYRIPPMFTDEIHESFDKVLACLEPIRGVQKVVFADDVPEYLSLESGWSELVGTANDKERFQQIVAQSYESTEE